MSVHLLHKNTFRAGYIPQPHDLVVGQLGITIHTGEVALWTKDDAGNIVQIGSGGGGGSGMPVYNGMLTLEKADGSVAGTFTANQPGNVSIRLPEGFSGDYNDLINKPDINDGKLTIKDAEGNVLGTFTANQKGATDVNLPATAAAGAMVTFGDTFPDKPAVGAQHVMSDTLYEYVWDDSYWVQIDTPGKGGGLAGSAQVLNDLLDVTVSSPKLGDVLQHNDDRWTNLNTVDGGDY